jgi:hypothetical protein
MSESPRLNQTILKGGVRSNFNTLSIERASSTSAKALGNVDLPTLFISELVSSRVSCVPS